MLSFRHAVGLLWTNDQPDAKAYTGQHNAVTQETSIHAPSEIQTNDPSNQAAKTYALDRAAKGIGHILNIEETILF
jgi:hypothetical protein